MILLGILLLAALLRLVFLDTVPIAITGDELSYVLTAKSFLLTGQDITGTISLWQILLFQYPPLSLPQAELPYFLLLPFVTGNLSLFMVHIPFALLGVALVYALYLVTKELINRPVALLSAFFAAINPWFLFINRSAYEMTPAIVFYLFGLYVLLKTKGWKIFLAFPFFILAFYSYIATKLIFLPFLVLTLGYLYFFKHKRKFGKQYGIFFLLSLGFVGLFAVLLHSQSGSRVGDILFPNSPLVIEQVDNLRKGSMQTPITNLFINKATVYGQMLMSNFLNAISVPYLFLSGDNFFGIWRHGLFYSLDILFLIAGIFSFVRKQKSLLFLLLGAIFIGFLPEIFHRGEDNFTPHITFIFPFVLILVASGVMHLSELTHRYMRYVLGGVLAVYAILVTNFFMIYFFQYPIQGQSDFPVRLLSRYITLAKENGHDVIVYSQRSNDLLRKHLFYGSVYTSETAVPLRTELTVKEPHVANVSFRSCDEKINPAKAKEIIITTRACEEKFSSIPHSTIPLLKDGGSVYSIYNDMVCSKYALKQYPSGLLLSDFTVEKLSQQKFCETFITSLF